AFHGRSSHYRKFLWRGGEPNGTDTSIGSRALARERRRSGDGRSVSAGERVSTAARSARAVRSRIGTRTHGALRAAQVADAAEDRRALDGGRRSQAARRVRRRPRIAGAGGGARAHHGSGARKTLEVRAHQRIAGTYRGVRGAPAFFCTAVEWPQ